MPLNPQTQKLVNKLLESRKQIIEMSIAEARELSLQSFKLLGGKLEPVKNIADKVISGPYGDIPIRIYSANDLSTSPVLIYFFGGGFVWGSIEGHDTICRALANATNCKIISVSYRLAPEYKFPVAVDEAWFATKWIFDNSEKLGVNRKHIAISGYSSGGNLAALTAIKARNEKLPLAYQVLICPWLDLSCSTPSYKKYSEGYLTTPELLKWMVGHYLPSDKDVKDAKISPLFEANLKGLAPALIITAEFDPLVDEGKLYADKLYAANVETIYSCYLGQIHSLLAYRGELDQEKNPIDEIGTVIKKIFFNK